MSDYSDPAAWEPESWVTDEGLDRLLSAVRDAPDDPTLRIVEEWRRSDAACGPEYAEQDEPVAWVQLAQEAAVLGLCVALAWKLAKIIWRKR